MSWLRSSPMRQSIQRRGRGMIDTSTVEFDPKACFDSFRKHWQQAYDVMKKSTKVPSDDDVVGVVNLLDYMLTLLLVELHNANKLKLEQEQQHTHSFHHHVNSPCLEYTLSENILDKLYEWSLTTGGYSNVVRLELLKLFELLVSHSRNQLLVHEPFLRPLLKMLGSSQDEIYPIEVEKRLVILLNQLCVLLMQNVDLLDLFFFSTSQHQDHGKANFIIFSLLIPYVHRDGTIGHQARDALLLCMSLSQKNSNVGEYIAYHSSMCPVLVTGLGGLYSLLPNMIEINTPDWHRITPDDVGQLHELTLFMNSLEFINAVTQVAHKLIRQQLLDFMYQGFLIPVLGSTLMQIFKTSHFQSNVESQVSAMAYLDLILRTVTEPGLMKIFISFLLDDGKFDGQRMLDILVDRLNSQDTRLCVVTLALFDTLLSLNNEDLMAELVLKFVHRCQHIPLAHKRKINEIEPYMQAADYFLKLTPEVMRGLDEYASHGKTIWYVNSASSSDSLYSNYHAYLFDAYHKVANCQKAYNRWVNKYCYQKGALNSETGGGDVKSSTQSTDEHINKVQIVKQFLEEVEAELGTIAGTNGKMTHDSLQSIGESSGYESFRYRPEDEDVSEASDMRTNQKEEHQTKVAEPWKVSSQKGSDEIDLDLSEDLFIRGTVNLGPFIAAVWGKLQTFTSNSVYVNLQLTGVISRLARYPIAVLHTILLRPDIPTTSDVPSFQQVLRILKQQIDAELPIAESSLEYVEVARSYLIEREQRLIRSRKSAGGDATKMQQTPIEPFQRSENKRKSLSTTLTSIFKRPGSTTSKDDRRDSTEPTSLESSSSPFSSLTVTLGSPSTSASTNASDRDQNLAICAVLLDEWLKELSAIAQEHYIVMLPSDGTEINGS